MLVSRSLMGEKAAGGRPDPWAAWQTQPGTICPKLELTQGEHGEAIGAHRGADLSPLQLDPPQTLSSSGVSWPSPGPPTSALHSHELCAYSLSHPLTLIKHPRSCRPGAVLGTWIQE